MLDTDTKRRIDPICARHVKQRRIDAIAQESGGRVGTPGLS